MASIISMKEIPANDKVRPIENDKPQEGFEKKQPKETNKEPENRDKWGSKLDFIFSTLSYSVGLGAVWRFPYLAYDNGGGAFLIPFFIFMIIVGVPMMYLELSVGQFMSRGPVLSWVMVPLFKGVGISMNLINNYVNIYYIMIIAYSLYFLVLSLTDELPWTKCTPPWSNAYCIDNFTDFVYTECNSTYEIKCPNFQCYNVSELINASCDSVTNQTISNGYYRFSFASQDFWENKILHKTESVNEPGDLVWELVVALLVAWVVCFLCLFRGIKLSGKITYFTAIFPYIVLFILGIYGWTLKGAGKGVKYFIEPDLSKLTESKIWVKAAVQVFFTLSLSYGGLVALSSYNRFDNNTLRDTFILSVVNFLTCILAGLVVFGYLGHISELTGLDMKNVAAEGPGLVYAVYPYAVTLLVAPPVWSVMFFLMMLALGMGTMMASVETLSTSLEDFFPVLKKNKRNKALNLGIICLLYFLAGLLLCCGAGIHWIKFFDTFSGNWAMFAIGIVECVSVSWFYGVSHFKTDIRAMVSSGHRLYDAIFYLWEITWTIITPGVLFALTLYEFITYKSEQPGIGWYDPLGNALSSTSLLGIIIWAIYEIHKRKKSLKTLIEPNPEWHPLHESDIELVRLSYLNPQRSLFENKAARSLNLKSYTR